MILGAPSATWPAASSIPPQQNEVVVSLSPTPGARGRRALVLVALSLAAVAPLRAQQPTVDRETYERGRKMLDMLVKDIREHYYDKGYHGLDLDAEVAKADSQMKHAPNAAIMTGAIAQFFFNFKDSHMFFLPPSKVATVDYGVRTRFSGDTCFIIGVEPKTDAESWGLKPGDAILQWDRFKVERNTWWTLSYVYNSLSPREKVTLVVKSPGQQPRGVELQAKIIEGERTYDLDNNNDQLQRVMDDFEDAERASHYPWREMGDSVMIWKVPSFIGGDEERIDKVLAVAKRHKALILDLRDDGGGAISTQLYITGSFLDKEQPVFTMRMRSGDSVQLARVKGREPYTGKLVILVNQGSASSSEITARALQLAGRATIVGDRSAGAVETSLQFHHTVGFERVVGFGGSVAIADVIMNDGKRLEEVGVVPDVLVLPTGDDIANKRDPQLAKALELAGVHVDPVFAGKLFRRRDQKEDASSGP